MRLSGMVRLGKWISGGLSAAVFVGVIALTAIDDVGWRAAGGELAFNYPVMPHRPAGGVWTSAHDLVRYVQLELARQITRRRAVALRKTFWPAGRRRRDQKATALASEVELQGHFNSSRGHCHTGNCAEGGRRGDVAGRRREARMIRQIEELRAEQ